MTKKDIGYSVQVFIVSERTSSPPIHINNYFTHYEDKETIKQEALKLLPPLGPGLKYDFIIKETQNLKGLYILGKLGSSSY